MAVVRREVMIVAVAMVMVVVSVGVPVTRDSVGGGEAGKDDDDDDECNGAARHRGREGAGSRTGPVGIATRSNPSSPWLQLLFRTKPWRGRAADGAGCGAGVSGTLGVRAAMAEPRKLLILHFNDVYNVGEGKGEPCGGVPRFSTLLNRFRGENPFIAFSGDALNPSKISIVTRGRHMLQALQQLGVHASVLGNHDLDHGVENFRTLVREECSFPWFCSNVFEAGTDVPFAGCARKAVVEWEGVRLGLIGLVEQEWIATLGTVDADEIAFRDFVEVGRELGRELREVDRCEFVIALTCVGWWRGVFQVGEKEARVQCREGPMQLTHPFCALSLLVRAWPSVGADTCVSTTTTGLRASAKAWTSCSGATTTTTKCSSGTECSCARAGPTSGS